MRKHLHTEIEIAAPAAVVWAVLTDLPKVRQWNDFLLRLEGETAVGAQWRVEMQVGARKPMRFTPRIIEWEAERVMRWLGRTGVRGLFDGEHGFVIEPLTADRVRFVHEERFSGILVRPLLWMLGDDLPDAFEAFNRALKARAEALHAAGDGA